MASKKKDHRESVVGPWAEEKLGHLEAYLNYYTTRLKKTKFKLIYVDAFAGAPTAKIRQLGRHVPDDIPELDIGAEDKADLEAFVLGSPHRALALDPGFAFNYFFDLDENRVGLLEELRQQYPEKHVDVRCGDANELLTEFAQKIKGRPQYKCVAFLDPYGPHLAWDTVAALAATGSVEVIINFPAHMALNRMLLTGSRGRNPDWERVVSRVMGGDEWIDDVYRTTSDLFGEDGISKADDTPKVLLEHYKRQLKSVFKFVSDPAIVSNTRGVPLYYLIWAGPRPEGLVGARYILGDRRKLSRTAREGRMQKH